MTFSAVDLMETLMWKLEGIMLLPHRVNFNETSM